MNELLLGVNIDHIATVRNARGASYPDPIQAAFIALQAGADSITVHLREDRRHIIDRDIHLLQQTIETRMNLEMAITEEMLEIACKLKPYSCCLVPENRKEITTEGGLDVIKQQEKIRSAGNYLKAEGILISLFIDANEQQIDAAVASGISCVEIHTGSYSEAKNNKIRSDELARIRNAVSYAKTKGLKVNAGHGLNYYNVQPIAALVEINELNIGHAIIARALMCGLSSAVKEMKWLIREARR